jgi:hypothetical protein
MPINDIREANFQSLPIAQVVCSLTSVANTVNIIQGFPNAGISLMTADDNLLCLVAPETARCLFEREKVLTTSYGFDEEGLDEDDDSDDDAFGGPKQAPQ